MTPRKRVRASPRAKTRSPRRKTIRKARAAAVSRIKATPPSRAADPFAKKTGRRRNYYTGEFLAEAKRRIETTLQSTTSIAVDLGIHNSILWRLVRHYGWVRPEGSLRLRGLSPVMRLAAAADALVGDALVGEGKQEPSAHSRESGNPVCLDVSSNSESEALGPRFRGDERHDKPGADLSTIDRLEQAVLKELATVETMRASLGAEPLRPMDAERTARTLSTLTETLAKLRRLRLGAQPQPDSTDDDIPDIDAFRLDLARRIDLFVASRADAPDADGDPGAAAVGEAG